VMFLICSCFGEINDDDDDDRCGAASDPVTSNPHCIMNATP